jgi:hypothetical protein
MSSTNRITGSTSAANEALVPPAETVRACADRQRRLTEYIRSHTGEDIAVRLTPCVPTACVMPTSKETLIESDNADLSSEEAQQLANSVDGDYLVLISTAPAAIDRLPITDQLTADRAQQFGYALHELGHIRYTAIAASASRIKDRVEEEHQDFVRGLWNSCEDAAIENQLAADQSQLAADRLEIVNRSVSTPADEFSMGQQIEFSFRDAIETALYDRGIYETNVCKRLCDSDNHQFVFAADADRQAFVTINDSIDDLLATILTTPSSTDRVEALLQWWEAEIEPLLSPPNQDKSSSKQQGEDEAQSEDTTSGGQSQDNAGQHGEPSTEQQREEDETSQTADGDGDEERAPNPSSETAGERENESEREADRDSETSPDPSAINTDQRQETPGTDALEYPDVGDKEDAEALRQPSENAGTGSELPEDASASGDNGSSNEDNEPETGSESESESESESGAESSKNDEKQGGEESIPEDATNGSESPANSNEGADEFIGEDSESGTGRPTSDDSDNQEDKSEGGSGEEHSGDSTSSASAEANPWMDSDSGSQTSLGSFAQMEDQPESNDDESPSQREDDPIRNDGETSPEDFASDSSAPSNGKPNRDNGEGADESNSEDDRDSNRTDVDTPETKGDSESASTETVGDNKPDGNDQIDLPEEETTTTDYPDQKGEPTSGEDGRKSSEESSGGERGDLDEEESNQEAVPLDPTPAHEDSNLETSDALDTDRKGARDEAERSTPDEAQLERDLEDVAAALDELTDEDGGTGAVPESLDELTIMPDSVDVAANQSIVNRWNDADADAGYVADALRKALKESRRTGHRSGLTSGSFDRRRAAALARGEVTAFQVRQPGDQKQYDLVLILDRSGSMRTKISTAENALVRFAIACENVGINVGIIDFYDEDTRLIKPFSVETQYVQPSLFSGKYVGGTPLADALGIGRELLEQRRNNPLVIVVTDGKPGEPGAYQDELARSYAPVCGLTLVLNHPKGSVPDEVVRNERFYDRHVYVHEPDQLVDRLDQFAIMFDGL